VRASPGHRAGLGAARAEAAALQAPAIRRAARGSLLAAILWLSTAVPPAAALDLELYARILSEHTHEAQDTAGTRVDYLALRSSPRWRSLIASLAASRPAELRSREEKLAFWLNAYNVLAMRLVAKHYPVESIRDIGSLFRPVWGRSAGTIDGRSYSLDEIEDDILRPLGDPRIHGAINCASTSCPSLRREPFEPARIDAQLDDSVRRFLAEPRKGLAIDPGASSVRLSKIFDWFEDDFEAGGGVLDFVAKYAPEGARAWLLAHGRQARVRYLPYDWQLNDGSGKGAP
jgi:hypothetical protein